VQQQRDGGYFGHKVLLPSNFIFDSTVFISSPSADENGSWCHRGR